MDKFFIKPQTYPHLSNLTCSVCQSNLFNKKLHIIKKDINHALVLFFFWAQLITILTKFIIICKKLKIFRLLHCSFLGIL